MEQVNPLSAVKEPYCVCTKKSYLMILCTFLLVFLSSSVTYIIVKSQLTNQGPVGSSIPTAQTSPMPPASKIANWKVYVSDKLGLSFEYPDSVTVSEEGEITRLTWQRYNTSGIIRAVENIGNLSLKDYAINNLCSLAAKENKSYCEDQVNTSIGRYTNGSTEGVVVVYNLFENPILTYLFSSEGKIARFEFSGETGTSVEDLDRKVIDQILSTFKFN